eukprot:1338982-Prymnesium_polylepis.1
MLCSKLSRTITRPGAFNNVLQRSVRGGGGDPRATADGQFDPAAARGPACRGDHLAQRATEAVRSGRRRADHEAR